MTAWVVVVGGGPAGLMAAREIVLRGARATVIDEFALPGGQIYRQANCPERAVEIGLDAERARKRAILSAFGEVAGRVEYLSGASAYSLFPGPELHVAHEGATRKMRPDAVVLATGVCERAFPFPGWTLPGVVFAGGVQALLKANGIRAGDRVVVAGAGPLPLAVAAQLVEASAAVPCVALVNPLRAMLRKPAALWAGRAVVWEGLRYLSRLRGAGTKLFEGWVPVRALGTDRVEGVVLARHAEGRPIPRSERTMECDLLALNFGFVANTDLVRMVGAEVEFQPHRGGWIPKKDGFGRTTVERVLVAGDGAELRGAFVAPLDGRIVGAAAVTWALGESVTDLEGELADLMAERRRHRHFQEAIQESLRLPDGIWSLADQNTVCCRCEGVTRQRLQRAIDDGHTTLNALKRNTRAGMGWCGGRICAHTLAAFANGGRLTAGIDQMTPRPVAKLVTLGEIANEHDP